MRGAQQNIKVDHQAFLMHLTLIDAGLRHLSDKANNINHQYRNEKCETQTQHKLERRYWYFE